MERLTPAAEKLASLLTARRHTVAVAESASGGLVSAALLAVPGASAYYLGGGVIYTQQARTSLLAITADHMNGLRPSSQPYASLLARTVRGRLNATWGIAETGAAGPSGNRYGDAAGHTCIAVSGPVDLVRTIETGSADRVANMCAFASDLLELFTEALQSLPGPHQ
ncbi:CinA family protein [Roseomonas sp. WA12]